MAVKKEKPVKEEVKPTNVMPSFIKAGDKGSELSSGGVQKFVRLEEGTACTMLMLTGVNPPEGEEPNGKNCVISFNRYTIWLDESERGEGVMSPMFPQVSQDASDPGKMLGLKPRMTCFAIVVLDDEEEEKIFSFGKMVFNQLTELEMSEGSLKGRQIRVTKRGTGLNTKYTVVLRPKTFEIEGEPETDLIEFVGPTTREGVIELLENSGHWPPEGGDPYAPKKAKKPPVVADDDEDDDDFEDTE